MARPLSAKIMICGGADQERCEFVSGITLGVTSRHVKTWQSFALSDLAVSPKRRGS